MSDSESSSAASSYAAKAHDDKLNDHRRQPDLQRPDEEPVRFRRALRLHLEDDTPAGILKKRTRRNLAVPDMHKVRSNDTFEKPMRRPLRTLVELDGSHALRLSQETEEDVCFPLLREHVRINGVDFDEIEDFINEEPPQMVPVARPLVLVPRTTGALLPASRNAMKYTPKRLLARLKGGGKPLLQELVLLALVEKVFDSDSEQVKFGATTIREGDATLLPERFSFFHSDNEETVHAPDLPLLMGGDTAQQLFKNGVGTWWLDCTCPTDAEMKTLAKAFGIHPLTAEDIRMQELREKVELFRNYYFVCFHTFEPDKELEDYLEPIHVYIVVFRNGVLTFHFTPVLHPANVRRRVRQLRDYVDVSADWLCYALIDDITDGFAPVITAIEYEADAIEELVLLAQEYDFSFMLRKIGESRRKVMTVMRLLSNKADVIKMFAKRCQDEVLVDARASASGSLVPEEGISFGPGPGAPPNLTLGTFQAPLDRVQPRADIALYLGDIQDHVVTMFQNLLAYEKIFSRSHSNYLAQLQVELFNANLRVTEILGSVTLLGTFLLPLNVITGLFGMNVHVPGQDGKNLHWFGGIIGVMAGIVITLVCFVKWYLTRAQRKTTNKSTSISIRSLGMKYRLKDSKSMISFPNRYE